MAEVEPASGNAAAIPTPRASDVPPITPETSETPNLDLNVDALNGMTAGAIACYKDSVLKFAVALGREASRLEEADRAQDIDNPEITTTMVVRANELLRHPPVELPKISINVILAQLIAFLAAIMTPIFGADLHSGWQWTATVTCAIIAVSCQSYAIIVPVRRK